MTEMERAAYATATAVRRAAVEALDADLDCVLAFWQDARTRGWEVTVYVERSGWRAVGPDQAASVGYRPADEMCCGEVSAHDAERTMDRTGVASASEAVGLLREFLGWSA